MSKIRMFKIGNYANGNLICQGIFPAQSEASAKQLYNLNDYTECKILQKFGWCDIQLNDMEQSYDVNLNGDYVSFSLDRARDAYSELVIYNEITQINPSNNVVEWLCSSIQQSIQELNRQCARSYNTQL